MLRRRPASRVLDQALAVRPEEDGAEPHGSPEPGLEEALFELDRYQWGFENLERQVRVLDRERQKLAVVLNNARVGFLVDYQLRMTWANPWALHRVRHSSGGARAGPTLLRSALRLARHLRRVPGAARAGRAAEPAVRSRAPTETRHSAGTPPPRLSVWVPRFDQALVMVQDLTDLEMLRRSESSLSGQKHVLELMARGAALDEVLTAIALLVEERRPGCPLRHLAPGRRAIRN